MAEPTGTNFLRRYAVAFGSSEARLLQVTGLLGGEVSADGGWITDTTGRRWLDFGSFGMHLLGHRHPVILAAALDQLALMGLSGKVLGNAAATGCAEALLAATDPQLSRVVLANTGGEAVDMAVKMAILSTDREELLAVRGSYHGRTVAALAVSDAAPGCDRVGLRNRVHIVAPGDLTAADAALRTGRVAAAFVEPVQGEGGIRSMDPEFLAGLRTLCDRTGTLLVLDEIQTGLGRCGRRWRSADDCVPDLLLTGKQLGGGLVPLSAVVYRGTRVGPAARDPLVLGSSFSGGALAGRVGATVLALVCDEALLDRVRRLGAAALARLRRELAGDPRVRDVRGEGLMLGLELASPSLAGRVILEAARRNVLVSFCLNQPHVLRVYPPAVVTPEELDGGLRALAAAVAACPMPDASPVSS